MFTGVVTSVGTIEDIAVVPAGKRFRVRGTWTEPNYVLGESIAIDGACVTVVATDGDSFSFEASPETLTKTTLATRGLGDAVNLERALAVGDRMGGHHVTGHVDGVGHIERIEPDGDCLKITFGAPTPGLKYLVAKGSIAIDGISLTVNAVNDADGTFDVMLIPHTQQETSLRGKGPGDPINLEFDLLSKYVERLVGTG